MSEDLMEKLYCQKQPEYKSLRCVSEEVVLKSVTRPAPE